MNYGSTMTTVITPLVLAITALAVARVTRLVTDDYLLAEPRARTIQWLGEESKLAYLLTCPWCVSIYIAAAAAPAADWAGHSPWYLIPATALALSHVTGLLAQLGGE